MLHIYVGFQAINSIVFLPQNHHYQHQHISIVFFPPPPSPPHFYCFSSSSFSFLLFSHPPPPNFYCFSSSSSSSSSFLLVFPPPAPHFYSFSSSSFSSFYCFLSFAHSFHFFPPRDSIKDCQLPSFVHFEVMSHVVNNNRGFLQLLAEFLSGPVSFNKDSYSTTTPCTSPSLIQCTHGTHSYFRRK